jgi:hypothetical protein
MPSLKPVHYIGSIDIFSPIEPNFFVTSEQLSCYLRTFYYAHENIFQSLPVHNFELRECSLFHMWTFTFTTS